MQRRRWLLVMELPSGDEATEVRYRLALCRLDEPEATWTTVETVEALLEVLLEGWRHDLTQQTSEPPHQTPEPPGEA
jgi:hypothetical protein